MSVLEPFAHVRWQGTAESAAFTVQVPMLAQRGNVIGTVTVFCNGIPAGVIKFKLRVEPGTSPATLDLTGDTTRRFEIAFISYASADRAKVLPRIQMLPKLGIKFFQDIIHLEAGERWARKLYEKIDQCDLFLLFWSTSARDSEWVMKEARYALARKDGREEDPPEIVPVPIEGPPPVKPPPDLAHLHFNDPMLYFIGAE